MDVAESEFSSVPQILSNDKPTTWNKQQQPKMMKLTYVTILISALVQLSAAFAPAAFVPRKTTAAFMIGKSTVYVHILYITDGYQP